MSAQARGWCPRCSRRLSVVRIDLSGNCPTHGSVPADFSPGVVVLDAESVGPKVLGRFVSLEPATGTVRYQRDDGELVGVMIDAVDCVDAETDELGGSW